MKKYTFVLLFAGAALVTACSNHSAPSKDEGIILGDLDTTVHPGDNFFEYAGGGWIKANAIPADQSRWGTFNKLAEDNKQHLKEIAETAAASTGTKPGSPEQLVGDFYASAMDTVAIEKAGSSPIRADMDAIDGIADMKGVLAMVARLQMWGANPMFGFYAGQDPKNSDVVVPQIYQGGLSLPDRDFYLMPDARSTRIRDEYLKHVSKMFQLYGLDEKDASGYANTVMRIETDLARASMTREEQRDPYKTYHKVTLAELDQSTPSLSWTDMMHAMHIDGGYDYLVLGQPLFLAELENQLKHTPLADWKVYLKWHLLNLAGNVLSNDFVMEDYHFNNEIMNGQKAIQARWKRMVSLTDGFLGDALGQLYVAKYFPPEAKKKADELVSNLMAVYKDRLENLDWMSTETKKKAVEKLNAIIRKIGYPDKWKTYAGLEISRDNFFQNLMNAGQWNYQFMVNKIGKPVDRTEWLMTPPTVNAYYNPSVNEIVFPAGILQPPFFNAQADDAVNYGAIGAVIGHELTHGFDDQGRQFDAKGNLTNWWTSEDSAQFEAKAKRLIDQFNQYTVLDSIHVKGEMTLGENIADLGGLSIAYEAFKRTPEGKGNEMISGYTPDQRFFLGFGRIWAGSIRDEMQAQRIITDYHSPAIFRVNGPVSNLPEFYAAFNVKEGDQLFRKPEDRAKIW